MLTSVLLCLLCLSVTVEPAVVEQHTHHGLVCQVVLNLSGARWEIQISCGRRDSFYMQSTNPIKGQFTPKSIDIFPLPFLRCFLSICIILVWIVRFWNVVELDCFWCFESVKKKKHLKKRVGLFIFWFWSELSLTETNVIINLESWFLPPKWMYTVYSLSFSLCFWSQPPVHCVLLHCVHQVIASGVSLLFSVRHRAQLVYWIYYLKKKKKKQYIVAGN